MLSSVRNYLSQFGEVDERILEAMNVVDRKNFMDKNQDMAYIDTAMPIGDGQTISQPSTVARMLQLLELKEGDNVLEIGAGSGWNAGLIGFLVGDKGEVLSLEVVNSLMKQAQKNLKKFKNVKIEKKDFRKLREKFDKIIFTAGILQGQEKIMESYAFGHLNEGGILVCPYQSGPLIILRWRGSRIKINYTREEYVFVPLVLK